LQKVKEVEASMGEDKIRELDDVLVSASSYHEKR